MNDITLMDVLYTASMLFIAFYGAIIITKLLAKFTDHQTDEDEKVEEEKEAK